MACRFVSGYSSRWIPGIPSMPRSSSSPVGVARVHDGDAGRIASRARRDEWRIRRARSDPPFLTGLGAIGGTMARHESQPRRPGMAQTMTGTTQQAGLGGPGERRRGRRRATSTPSCSAGRWRSIRIPSTAATASPRSAAATRPGSGRSMDPNAPTAWSLYIGTDDIEALARSVDGQRRFNRHGAVRRR